MFRHAPTGRSNSEQTMIKEPVTHLNPLFPDASDLDIVLTQSEAAKMLRLSDRTLQRLDELGKAPPRIQLTGRRVGYWKRDCFAWLKARTAPAKHAA